MTSQLPQDIDKLIENEKRALVKECLSEIWSELTDEGLDPSMVAEVMIEAVLKRLINERGNDEATRLLEHFRRQDEMGHLPQSRTLQ